MPPKSVIVIKPLGGLNAMKYISKGIVVNESTEQRLSILRCGYEFLLTGTQAALWQNGQFAFSDIQDGSIIQKRALEQLRRQELVEIAENNNAGFYRALTRCVIAPVSRPKLLGWMSRDEGVLYKWLCQAGIHLTLAELVFLTENKVLPADKWMGEDKRQELTDLIYDKNNIFDNMLETQMEHADCRDDVVHHVLSLLKKKRIVLL